METVPGGHGGVAWREQRRTVRASSPLECAGRTGGRESGSRERWTLSDRVAESIKEPQI